MTPIQWRVIATQVPAGGSLGGVVRYTTELLAALAARDDVVVSAVTTRAAADTVQAMIGGGRIITLADAPAPALALAERHAPLAALRGGVDVVHGIKHLVPRRSRALRVLTVHDMILLDRPADFGVLKRSLLPRDYLGSIRDADLLLCVSEATRQRLVHHVPGAQPRSAVVRLATSSSLRASRPQPLPVLGARPFALVVGDASSRKNLQTLVAAWPAVRAAVPDAVLAIAGPPNWSRSVAGASYDQLVSAGAIVPLGHVSDAELRWAYEQAVLVLCPSVAEGFGLPAAEALDLGASVIVSDDAAVVEVSAGRALEVVPALDAAAWSTAVVRGLKGERIDFRPGRHRTWDDVAEESVAAVRRVMSHRA